MRYYGLCQLCIVGMVGHDDVIKWKHFPRYWPFVRGIHRSPVNSPHKGQWRGALMFSLICVWINGWVNNREAGDLRRYRAHSDVTVMVFGETGGHRLMTIWCHNKNVNNRTLYQFIVLLTNKECHVGVHMCIMHITKVFYSSSGEL